MCFSLKHGISKFLRGSPKSPEEKPVPSARTAAPAAPTTAAPAAATPGDDKKSRDSSPVETSMRKSPAKELEQEAGKAPIILQQARWFFVHVHVNVTKIF